jgi:8-oxo-dGTP diphosphatase
MLIVVAAALIDSAGRVLVQKRAAGRAMAGLWEFPGGKMEGGETPQSALARELEEELGIEVAPSALSPATFASEESLGRHMLLLLFVCRSWKGDPKPLDASELQWVMPDQLKSLKMPPPDVPLVKGLVAMMDQSALG